MITCCVFFCDTLSFLTHCAFAYLFVFFSLVGAFRTVFSLVRYVWDAEGSICWRSAVGWSFLIFVYYPLLQVLSVFFVFLSLRSTLLDGCWSCFIDSSIGVLVYWMIVTCILIDGLTDWRGWDLYLCRDGLVPGRGWWDLYIYMPSRC